MLIRILFIIVSYAITTNKPQGQSLEMFSHGQLYIVISRVQSKKRLNIVFQIRKKGLNIIIKMVNH
ncbi:hypothetical protein Lal_00036817 [Lupinus albus]|nr:hypothetical protein Lal_00036817 [Lupinus albus]